MMPATSPRLTNTHRQPRQPDPDLASLDRRISALEAAAEPYGAVWQVALLRRRYSHLWRDRHVAGASWFTEAAALLLSIERAEAMQHE